MTELKCYVIAHGVKKRCRKITREMIKLENQPLGTTFEDVKTLALSLVGDTVKIVGEATIHLDVVEIELCDGYVMENWQMFDKRHQKQVLIEKAAV